MSVRTALLLLLAGTTTAQCPFDPTTCKVTCPDRVYDLSSYATPTGGWFARQDSQPSWLYFAICPVDGVWLDPSKIQCSKSSAASRQLQDPPQGPGAPSVIAVQDWGDACTPGTPCTLTDNPDGEGDDCRVVAKSPLPPAPCTANGTAGITCTFGGGDSDPDGGARQVEFNFVCAPEQLNPAQVQVECTGGGSACPAVQYGTTYAIDLPGPAGCGVPIGGGGGGGGLSGGSLFCILLSVAIVVYLGGGIAYNYKYNELTGVEAVPQIEYWQQLPGLVKDGCKFSYEQSKKAYVAIRDRNKDPSLTESLARSADGAPQDDMAAALDS